MPKCTETKLTEEIKKLKVLVKKLLPNERKVEWILAPEAARHLKIHRNTLQNWTAKGALKSYLKEGTIYYKLHELDEAPKAQEFGNFNYDA